MTLRVACSGVEIQDHTLLPPLVPLTTTATNTATVTNTSTAATDARNTERIGELSKAQHLQTAAGLVGEQAENTRWLEQNLSGVARSTPGRWRAWASSRRMMALSPLRAARESSDGTPQRWWGELPCRSRSSCGDSTSISASRRPSRAAPVCGRPLHWSYLDPRLTPLVGRVGGRDLPPEGGRLEALEQPLVQHAVHAAAGQCQGRHAAVEQHVRHREEEFQRQECQAGARLVEAVGLRLCVCVCCCHWHCGYGCGRLWLWNSSRVGSSSGSGGGGGGLLCNRAGAKPQLANAGRGGARRVPAVDRNGH